MATAFSASLHFRQHRITATACDFSDTGSGAVVNIFSSERDYDSLLSLFFDDWAYAQRLAAAINAAAPLKVEIAA